MEVLVDRNLQRRMMGCLDYNELERVGEWSWPNFELTLQVTLGESEGKKSRNISVRIAGILNRHPPKEVRSLSFFNQAARYGPRESSEMSIYRVFFKQMASFQTCSIHIKHGNVYVLNMGFFGLFISQLLLIFVSLSHSYCLFLYLYLTAIAYFCLFI